MKPGERNNGDSSFNKIRTFSSLQNPTFRLYFFGMLGQFVLLPAFSYLLVLALRPQPSIALGMLLVAACPGGNISNFLTHFARGNTALSITLTAVSTAAALVLTPLSFAVWGSLDPRTAPLLRSFELDAMEIVRTYNFGGVLDTKAVPPRILPIGEVVERFDLPQADREGDGVGVFRDVVHQALRGLRGTQRL